MNLPVQSLRRNSLRAETPWAVVYVYWCSEGGSTSPHNVRTWADSRGGNTGVGFQERYAVVAVLSFLTLSSRPDVLV
jgi:hypothetical protein